MEKAYFFMFLHLNSLIAKQEQFRHELSAQKRPKGRPVQERVMESKREAGHSSKMRLIL